MLTAADGSTTSPPASSSAPTTTSRSRSSSRSSCSASERSTAGAPTTGRRSRDHGPAFRSVPPGGLPRQPLRRAEPEAVRSPRSTRCRRRRCRQRRRAPGTSWDENADPFTNAVRITVSALRKRLGEPRSSPPWPASGTASTRQTSRGVRERRWKGPRLERSAQTHSQLRRLRRVAGAAARRYGCSSCATCPGARPSSFTRRTSFSPGRGALLRDFAPAAAISGVFLVVFGSLGGGSSPAGCSHPCRITDATRIAAADRCPTAFGYRAAKTSFESSPTPSTPCLPSSKRRLPNSRDSRPMPPTNCARHWRSRRPSRCRPQRSGS